MNAIPRASIAHIATNIPVATRTRCRTSSASLNRRARIEVQQLDLHAQRSGPSTCAHAANVRGVSGQQRLSHVNRREHALIGDAVAHARMAPLALHKQHQRRHARWLAIFG
jgi:hypothetical protein